ncbi:helix-turn-helix transcriptional regulator, partial [Dysosmobacter welbionis]
PLLVGKAGVAAVGTGIFDIDLLVGHVQVPAVHHRLFGVQIQQVVPDVVLPGHAVVQPGQLILGVWSVAAHQVEVRVLRRDDPPLVAVLIDTEVIGHGERLAPGEHRGAGIARLVGAVPVAVIAGQIKFCLLRAHLRLL